MKNTNIEIAGQIIEPGEQIAFDLPAAPLYSQTPVSIPIHIIHGIEKGPRVFLIAAVHGDEINGVEIIHRILSQSSLKKLRGTLIAIPVANVYGFMMLSRYLPDRRDLNRSFPGSKSGSLTARLAHFFMNDIIKTCDYGIDLHTGNVHSENLPHIRANTDLPGAMSLAKAFNVPVILDAKLPDGSIRQATSDLNIPVLLYEGGEALRFNELAIRIGVRGILNVLYKLGMIKGAKMRRDKKIKPKISRYSMWARSPKSGIFHPLRNLGTDVEKGEKLGVISDPFANREDEIFAPIAGIIIGKNTLPLVNEGDVYCILPN